MLYNWNHQVTFFVLSYDFESRLHLCIARYLVLCYHWLVFHWMDVFEHISYLLSVAVIDTMTKHKLEGEKAYFSFQLRVHHRGEPGKELKAGA